MPQNHDMAAILKALAAAVNSAQAGHQTYTDAERAAAFRLLAEDENARIEFMKSRAEVVLPLIDEQSTIRGIFQPENLAAGAQPVYDIPFDDVDAVFLMPQIGGVTTVTVEGGEQHVDTFGVDGGVEWQIDIAKDGRFQIAERATRMLANNFIKQEEKTGWALIKAHAAVLDASQQIQAYADSGAAASAGSGKMNVFTLSEVITVADEMGTGGRRVTDIYMSPRRFNDLRVQVGNAALPDTMREQAWSGSQNLSNPVDTEIRFHKVYNTALVADNKAYAFTQRDGYWYGVMPIRDRLTTRDNTVAYLEHKMGVMGRERYGLAIMDDKGLIEITF